MPPYSHRQRLRLLIVNYEFPPIGGGASHASFGLARTLAARGHQVDVLTSQLAGQSHKEEMEGFRIHRVRSWRHGPHQCGLRGAASFLIFSIIRLRSLLKDKNYDLIHYFFGLPCGVLSLYTHGRHGIPYIVSLRGSDVPDYDPTDRTMQRLHRLLAGITRKIWANARCVVANSTALRDLAARFSPALDFRVVLNAVVDRVEEPVMTQALAAPPIQVLCVARLIERKGIDTLLAAAALLKECPMELHVVGGGRDEQHLRDFAIRAGLAGRVIFHGSRSHEEVLAHCSRADVFVLPTLSESCSMALLEAMSRGLPVVATRVGGNSALVEQGRNGILFAPGDASELAAALRTLIDDAALRAAMSRASLEIVASKFTWPVNAEQYESIYRNALVSA